MFFIIPVGVDYRATRCPVVTFCLIGLNIVVFLVAFIHAFSLTGAEVEGWWYTNLSLTPASSPWYCWFTSLFVHAGFLHLIGNMIYLFLFGSPVEDLVGRWQFLAFYLLGGLASDLMHIAFTAEHFASQASLGGASGAISACMGAFALLMFRSKIEFKWIFFLFVRLWSGDFLVPTWLVMSFWFLSDLAGAFLEFGNSSAGTAYGAHVGGFACGIVLILIVKQLWGHGLMRPAQLDDGEAEKTLKTNRRSAPVRVRVRETPATFITDNGSQTGPFTLAEIRTKLAAGEISPEAWYWREGMEEWRGVWELTQ